MPDLIVIRRGEGLPADFLLPPDLDGKWFDIEQIPKIYKEYEGNEAVAVPTGRFETREDGAVAEVWEIRL